MDTSAFVIAGAPQELLDIINARRTRIPAGMTMTVAASEDGSAGTDGAQGNAQQSTQADGQVANADGPQGAWDGKVESLPQGAQDLIKGLRAENADKRTKAKGAEDDANAKIAAALKALGIETGGQDPLKAAQDAAATAASERDTERRARALADAELIVWRNAADLKVNAAAITDSRAFEAAVAKLDPSAGDFADKVKQAAQEAATTNPLLKAQAATGKTGAEFAGGTGDTAPKSKSLAEALNAVYSK